MVACAASAKQVTQAMSNPRITVIINSYNYEKYLRQAIESVIDQDYANREIIVVDDGSTDSSRDIIASYGAAIVPLYHENLGQARTCLRALHHATGEFVQFLDSDDYLLPGALTIIASRLSPDVAKVQFQLQPVGTHGEIVGRPWPEMAKLSREELIAQIEQTGTYVTPPNSGNAYRADIFRHIDDIEYESSIDGIPYLLAPFLGDVIQIDRPLGCYRYHSDNFSGHGTLSSSRFGLEAQRHTDRLGHLCTIARRTGFPVPDISNAKNHSFIHTRTMLRTISDGRRPSFAVYLKYSLALVREKETVPRIFKLMTWGLLVTIAPRDARRRLAVYRSDPRSRTSVVRAVIGQR